MVIDEYGNRRFYGIYRGVVADNADPLNQGRLKLRIPQVLFDQVTDWAWIRNSPGVVVDPPAVGHGVWVLFESGDPSFPVAIGTFGMETSKYPVFNTSQFITYDQATGTFGGSNAVPAGGAPGQILVKAGDSDYQTSWSDAAPAASFTSVLKHEVKAGEALTMGQAVYVSSATGTNMVVSKASNAAEATSSKTMGLIAQDLPNNGKGYVITEGLLAGLNTGTATNGDPVWLGTGGNLIYGLVNKPVAPAHLVFIGVVTRAQNVNGEIFVRPQNGFELNEIHDALISAPAAGDLVARNSANTLWQNRTAASLGIVTTSDTGSVTDTMLAGSIANAKLSNSSVTVNGSTVALGASTTITATPTAGSVVDASITGTGLSPSVITGTAVITTDSRLSDSRTPTAHASSHALGGTDAIPSLVPAGAMMQYIASSAPTGWLICDGSSFSSSTYPVLAALLGDTYGTHSGTTYYLPDLRGRVPIGAGAVTDTASQSQTFSLGGKAGELKHTLTTSEIPAHSHTGTTNTDGSHRHWISGASYDDGNMSTSGSSNSQDYGLAADAGGYTQYDRDSPYGRYSSYAGSTHSHAFTTATDGGTGGAHNNLQPYIVLNYIIKT